MLESKYRFSSSNAQGEHNIQASPIFIDKAKGPGQVHTWPLRLSQPLRLKVVIIPSLHSQLTLTLLSSCVENYDKTTVQ